MIESTLTLNASPLLDTLRRVDSAVTGFKGRIVAVAQSFEAVSMASEFFAGQLEKITQSLSLADKMGDLGIQTGSTSGEMLVLSQALRISGQGMDSAGMFTTRLQKALSGLNEDGQGTQETLTKLGLSSSNLRKMPILSQIEEVQKAFQGIKGSEDRVKLATDLFGKSGAALLPFFLDPKVIGTAKVQLGGLVDVVTKNSDAFGDMSDALESLDLKMQQFYTGVADGLDGNIKEFAARLNAIDFTKAGQLVGEFIHAFVPLAKMLLDIGKFFVEHKTFLIALGSLWLLNRVASLSFWAALSRGMVVLDGLKLAMGLFAAMLGKPGGAMRLMSALFAESVASMLANGKKLLSMQATLGKLSFGQMSVLAAGAWGGWQAGKWLGNKMTGGAEGFQARMDQIQGDRVPLISGLQKRAKNLHTEDDRKGLVGDIDRSMEETRKSLADAPKEFGGDLLNMVKGELQVTLGNLGSMKLRAEQAGLKPLSDPASGIKGPVSSLGRIGGALNNVGGGGGDMVSEQRRTNLLLQRVLNTLGGADTPPARPPVYHGT